MVLMDVLRRGCKMRRSEQGCSFLGDQVHGPKQFGWESSRKMDQGQMLGKLTLLKMTKLRKELESQSKEESRHGLV